MITLRDNPDGTCNCRPLGNSCFFADAIGNACDCKCHQPKHLKVKHTGEEQKGVLFTPLSQDDFLPGNYGADYLNEIFWLIIENMNDKKNNSQQAEEWDKQEPWVSIAGILYDVKAGAMFRFSALEEIKEYVDKLLLQARADERREIVEIIKKLQRRPETALETADEVGAYNHGLGLIINLIKEK